MDGSVTTDERPGESATFPPGEAFAVLGNETRLQILKALGEADEPLAFSELFDRIEYRDSSNFGYHLERLVGPFVGTTEAGYDLRQAGQRVVEAVLSGAVTEEPILPPTTIDEPCPFCSADTRVAYQQERVEMHCTECPGLGTGDYKDPELDRFDDHGSLGYLSLPPAGVRARSAPAVVEAAEHWTATQVYALARGICPRCSATIGHSIEVCEHHAVEGERCDRCDLRFAALCSAICTNCTFELTAPVPMFLGKHTEVLGFMVEIGVDPVAPEGYTFPIRHVEESIVSADPFEARYTFTGGDQALTLTVDEDISVTDVRRRRASEPT